MIKQNTIIFIDDSGDPGFKIKKGSSKLFIICCVIFDDELEAINAEAIFAELKEKKPYLFGETTLPIPATDKTKTKIYTPKGHIYTNQEIREMSIPDYKKNEEEIKRQEKAGLVK